MNTFLPFSDFEQSAKCLDKRRCFKQVVEAGQILNILDGKSTGWQYHPCVKMWVGYRDCLQYYYNVFYDYCEQIHKIKFIKSAKPILLPKYMNYPKWIGYEPFHYSHRCNLLRKSLEDLTKGRNELSQNLTKMNICINNGYDLTISYLWPNNKI